MHSWFVGHIKMEVNEASQCLMKATLHQSFNVWMEDSPIFIQSIALVVQDDSF